jgi:THO complex subunit 4
MKVELALDPSTLVSLAARVTPAPSTRSPATARRGKPGARTRNPRPAKKTAEQLDADMAVSLHVTLRIAC